METVALVPARGGSKGLPGKNLKKVGGRSLVERAVDVASTVDRIDRVVVSSDDPEILAEAERAGADARVRQAELAGDSVPTLAVVLDLLESEPGCSVVVILQPTSPLREPDDVARCLEALDEAHTATTVTALDHPPGWMFRFADHHRLEPLLGWKSMTFRRQDADDVYVLNGAVYAARAEHVRSGGALVGPGTVGVPMPPERSVDIDSVLDLEWVRFLVARDEREAQR